MVTQIGPFGFELSAYGNGYIVTISVEGQFWDYRKFARLELAEKFMADPLADQRPKPAKPVEIDRSYIELATKISRGRKCPRYSGAA